MRPDRTLLLRIDPRPAWRGSRTGRPTGSSRRTARSSRAIARAYDELAAAEPERIAVIDASQPPDRVLADALAALDSV